MQIINFDNFYCEKGQINVAQVRETYSTLAYVGARSSNSIESHYGLELSSEQENHRWSGYELAARFSLKKGYLLRGGRVDCHRGGNEILRDLQTGKLLFCLEPPLCEDGVDT